MQEGQSVNKPLCQIFIPDFPMFQPNPDKHWRIWLFIGSFVIVAVFSFWHYIIIVIVLYAVAKGLCSTNNHSKLNKRCRRRCRQWRR